MNVVRMGMCMGAVLAAAWWMALQPQVASAAEASSSAGPGSAMLAGGTTAADTREVRRAAAVHPEIAVPLPAGLLPPDPVARSAIDGHPRVREALAARVADRAAGDRLRAGIYEAQVEAGGQRRHLPGVAPSESDWQVGLSRPLRLPAKRDADLGIGARLSERGRLAVLEARHAVSRDLLAAWFERARRVETLALLTEQARVLGALEDVVRRRQRAGDASRLEALQAEAALRVAEGQRLAGEQRARAATIALERNFPELAGLASAAAVVAPPDRGLAGTRDAWTARILEANHEIALQRAQSEVRRAQAVRAGAERTPDPTVGLRASSDRGGQDRILGVFVAIPLPGAAREAQQREALALADESAARVATVEREVLAGALTAYETVLAADRAWSVLAEAHARSAEAARLAGRAFELGEGTLTDVLLARRGLLEATLAERQAALDALEARARLYLDAHLLWDFDEE